MKSIVLIPGLLCNQELWSGQAVVLGRYGDIVVADLSTQATIFEMASAVLEAAPEHFSLAGFSLGSQVALEIMSIAGERVERLALLSATHGGLLPPVEKAICNAIEIIEAGDFDGYLEAAYPAYVSASRISDPVLKRCFMDMAHAVGTDAGLRQMRALLQIKSSFSGLGQIGCPTLIIGGRDDRRTTPVAHQALAKEIPGSQLVMVDDAAHFTPLERPSVVAAWMERWISTD
jgi:pimeloyl-ACP methyl ester carboxylesterase